MRTQVKTAVSSPHQISEIWSAFETAALTCVRIFFLQPAFDFQPAKHRLFVSTERTVAG